MTGVISIPDITEYKIGASEVGMYVIPTGTYNIPDGLIIEFLCNMSVDIETDIRKSDIAKIKVIGRRAMREYIRKTYLK